MKKATPSKFIMAADEDPFADMEFDDNEDETIQDKDPSEFNSDERDKGISVILVIPEVLGSVEEKPKPKVCPSLLSSTTKDGNELGEPVPLY